MACRLGSARPDPVFAWGFPGILGVIPSATEVKAVFPSLSATVIPHAQEIRFRRGDSFSLDVQVQDDNDPPNAVDISRAVVKFGAKQGFGKYQANNSVIVGNEGLQILKQSYVTAEVEMIDATNGRCRIHIKKADTHDHPLVPMFWDVEVILPTQHLDGQPGTVIVQAGDPVVQGVGTDFETAGVALGDIIHIEDRHIMIAEVTGPTILKTDFTGWTGGSGLDYNLYLGASRVVASGAWTCLGDVVL
jgi:hypothetical protein